MAGTTTSRVHPSKSVSVVICASVQALCLVGEFNNWQPADGHWALKNPFGVWELFLPDKPDGTSAVPHRWVHVGCSSTKADCACAFSVFRLESRGATQVWFRVAILAVPPMTPTDPFLTSNSLSRVSPSL